VTMVEREVEVVVLVALLVVVDALEAVVEAREVVLVNPVDVDAGTH
jgi:hypothetical protein